MVLMAVLLALVAVANAKVLACMRRVRGRKGDCVELVVAHGGARRPCIDHSPHDSQRAQLMRPPIDQVADENCAPLGMLPSAGSVMVTHLLQQCLQPVRMAVDVADYVEGYRHLIDHSQNSRTPKPGL
jgi:hypothetical protein